MCNQPRALKSGQLEVLGVAVGVDTKECPKSGSMYIGFMQVLSSETAHRFKTRLVHIGATGAQRADESKI